MRDNITDREQIDLLKKWWNKHGKAIAIAVLIGLCVGFGWRYWNQHQLEKAEHASQLYQSLRVADIQKKFKTVKELSAQLMAHYDKTPYASLAALIQAREAVEANKLDAALKQLQWVVEKSSVNSLKQIARLRAARVLLADRKEKAALDFLKPVDDKTYQPLVDKVKADIYLAMGNSQAAKKAYESAQSMLSANNANDPFLTMQLVQLK